jgi:hypothetical protein
MRSAAEREGGSVTVYFIGGDFGMVKIGYTSEAKPENRLRDLQTGCPFPLRVLAYCKGNHADEQILHRALADERATGEWFRWSDRVAGLLGYVKEYRTTDGWAEALEDPARVAAYIKAFGSPGGFWKLDGLPRHDIAWRLHEATDYAPKDGRRLEWGSVVELFHGVAPVPERGRILHSRYSPSAAPRHFGWVDRGTGKACEWYSSRGGLARTAEWVARSDPSDDGMVAAIWILACIKDFIGRNQRYQEDELRRVVPEIATLRAQAGAIFGIEEPWHVRMNRVIPVGLSLPKNCALSLSEFVSQCALTRAAVWSAYSVSVQWAEATRYAWAAPSIGMVTS